MRLLYCQDLWLVFLYYHFQITQIAPAPGNRAVAPCPSLFRLPGGAEGCPPVPGMLRRPHWWGLDYPQDLLGNRAVAPCPSLFRLPGGAEGCPPVPGMLRRPHWWGLDYPQDLLGKGCPVWIDDRSGSARVWVFAA
ncbi:hypothetical protein quinque_002342 [Culex quinquefasciatus]